MKKVTNYLFVFFMSASVLFLASCGEDGETLPDFGATTIEFERSGTDITDTTVAPGTTITFDINVDFDENQAPLNLLVTDEDGNELVGARPLNEDPIQVLQTTVEIPADTSGAYIIVASLEDSDGAEVASETFTVNIEVADLILRNAIILAAPTGDETSESFVDASEGELYSFDEVVSTADPLSPSIDFGYFYGSGLQATICSPDQWPDDASLYSGLERWGTTNDTNFRTLGDDFDEDDFNSANNGDAIEGLFDANSANDLDGRATNLEEGNIIAFSTADGQFGLFIVNSITGTDGSDGRIDISIKISE